MNEVHLIGYVNEEPKDMKDPFYEGVWRTRCFIQVRPDPRTRHCENSKYDTIRIYAIENHIRNDLKKFKVGDPIVVMGCLKNDMFDSINVLSVQIKRIEFPPLATRRATAPKEIKNVDTVLDDIEIGDFDDIDIGDFDDAPF